MAKMKRQQKVLKNVIKKNIKHEDYKDALMTKKQMMHKMNTTTSECHQTGSYKLNKILLSCCDKKRYIHNDGITSYAYGHKNV